MRRRRSLRRKNAVGPRLALLILALVMGMPAGVSRSQRYCGLTNSACTACSCSSVKYAFLQLQQSSMCPIGVCLTLYSPIFMSLSRLPLTHRRDVAILFLPRLPSMHHIHPSPLDGSGSLQHCGQSRLNIKSPRTRCSNCTQLIHSVKLERTYCEDRDTKPTFCATWQQNTVYLLF